MAPLPIVLLILISSDSRDGVFNKKIMEILKETNLSEIVSGRSTDSPANNLLPPDIQFPGGVSKSRINTGQTTIKDKTLNEKHIKEPEPVALYSLVKDECAKGYILDENGICQKAVTTRSEKMFDMDRKKRSFFPLKEGIQTKQLYYNRLLDPKYLMYERTHYDPKWQLHTNIHEYEK